MRSKRLSKRKIKRRKKRGNFKFFIRRHTPNFFGFLKAIVLISVLVVLLHFLLLSGYFSIREVTVEGAQRFVNAEDVKQIAASSSLDKNIFVYNATDLAANLKDNFLGANDILVTRKYPKTINVKVIERQPIAIIFKDELEQFLVDKDGYVLGYTSPENTNLPKIHYKEDISVGLFIDKNLVPIYSELTSLLQLEGIKVSSLSFHPKHISFSLNAGEHILIGLEKNMLEAVKALSALLKQADVENKVIQRIDLRYDKVIVLFN